MCLPLYKTDHGAVQRDTAAATAAATAASTAAATAVVWLPFGKGLLLIVIPCLGLLFC